MIFETIVTTVDVHGAVHIAPMGVRDENGVVILAPFRPSKTLDNILATGVAVQNFCDDVRVFAGCVSGLKSDWPTLPASKIPCQRLAQTLAHSELQLEKIEDDALRPRLYCARVHDERHSDFRGFVRAQSAVLEGAILISRLHMLQAEKIDAEWEYLSIAIDKTAGPNEREAWAWLQTKLDEHRAKTMTTRP